MNKTKKGFLTASSIITIVASSFAILIALFLFLCGSLSTESLIKDTYLEDANYTYTEEVDGGYYFTGLEDGEMVTITNEEIESLAKIVSVVFYVMGVGMLAFSAAKMVLAIRILVLNGKNTYAKASVIALLVLNILNSNILEAVLLIAAMVQKDEIKPEDNKDKPLGLDDIKLDNMNF